MTIVFEVPVSTPSALNGQHGKWQAVAGKRKAQRAKVLRRMPPMSIPTVWIVRLTRVSAGVLDDDAVASALKSVRDAIAGRLGVDDGSKLVHWEYAQEKGAPGKPMVRVEIERVWLP